jgi:uncharacterized membrane protein YhaH (DUF805 family)
MKTTALWRNLTTAWTIIFFLAIIYDFIHMNALDDAQILLPIAIIYDAVLAIYSAEKEFRRWHDSHKTMHPGDLYVILWTILIFGLLGFGIALHRSYHIPAEVSASYVVVVGILAITKESKHFYRQAKDDTEISEKKHSGAKHSHEQ